MKKYELIALFPIIALVIVWIIISTFEHGTDFIMPFLILSILALSMFLWLRYWSNKEYKMKLNLTGGKNGIRKTRMQ